MKVRVTYQKTYDLDSPEFREEYEESMLDYPLSIMSLLDFIKDRFVDPNFDSGGDISIDIVPSHVNIVGDVINPERIQHDSL